MLSIWTTVLTIINSEYKAFEELSRASNELAHTMVSQGVVPAVSDEDILKGPPCVAILSESSLELLLNFLALAKIGHTVVLIA